MRGDQESGSVPRTAAIALTAAIPSVAFIAHAGVFRGWIIDDAGISFAYARCLAEGHGFVAQPGAEPVEGFSNALWTVLLAATHRFGLFDPVTTPKLVSGSLVLLSFVWLAREFVARQHRRPLAVGLALTATALATPFAVWTTSGLENALLVVLVTALLVALLRSLRRSFVGPGAALWIGLLCVALYLTRPDGAVYLPVAAALLAAFHELRPRILVLLMFSFLVPWTLVTAFRLAYFGDVLPNTYYAKRASAWKETAELLERLGTAAGGIVFIIVVASLVMGSVWIGYAVGSACRRRFGQRIRSRPVPLVLGALFLTAYAVFETLPTDWMPEYRFGTPLFLLAPLVATEFVRFLPLAKGSDFAATVTATLLVLAAGVYSWGHSRAFRAQPTVPLSSVRALSTDLDRFADRLGVARATVLLPDIGGSLWEDRFDVLDLAGLTDRTIGRTLKTDRQAFVNYVLTSGPDLVWVHGYWRSLADLQSVPAFQRDYEEASASAVLGRLDGTIYVRKDLPFPAGATR